MSTMTMPTTGRELSTWGVIPYLAWERQENSFFRSSRADWINIILRQDTTATFTQGITVHRVQFESSDISRDVSMLVAELKTDSGLTAEQLGRLLGVTRRTIHGWAAGAAITPAREKRVRALNELVFNLAAETPEARRNLLLDSSKGTSLFRQFSEEDSSNERIKYSVPVEERLGL